MLDLLEKLINEHGTSAILNERLGLIKAQYEALESENANLKTQCQAQQTEIQQIRMRLAEAESALDAMNMGTFAKCVCDHCGSSKLTRNGHSRRQDTSANRWGGLTAAVIDHAADS